VAGDFENRERAPRNNESILTGMYVGARALAGADSATFQRWQRLSPWRRNVALGGFAIGTFGLGLTAGGLIFTHAEARQRRR
jgi:hypothetical protein